MSTQSPSAESIPIASPTTPVATEPTTTLATDLTARLSAEIARLRADNDDLRASAVRWSRLYEAAIQRATAREAPLADLPESHLPARELGQSAALSPVRADVALEVRIASRCD